jgi:hypothetical protein
MVQTAVENGIRTVVIDSLTGSTACLDQVRSKVSNGAEL